MNEKTTAGSILTRAPFWVFVAVVPLIAVGVIVVAGFGSNDRETAASTPSKAASATAGDAIAIKDFTFSPDPITVTAGSTITVTNRDGTPHTVTAVKGAFDTGDLAGGASGSITIDRPGTYAYFCEIHQYMKGTLRAS